MLVWLTTRGGHKYHAATARLASYSDSNCFLYIQYICRHCVIPVINVPGAWSDHSVLDPTSNLFADHCDICCLASLAGPMYAQTYSL